MGSGPSAIFRNISLRGVWLAHWLKMATDDLLIRISSRSHNGLRMMAFDSSRVPRVIEHRARMAERPSAKKAIAEELAGDASRVS